MNSALTTGMLSHWPQNAWSHFDQLSCRCWQQSTLLSTHAIFCGRRAQCFWLVALCVWYFLYTSWVLHCILQKKTSLNNFLILQAPPLLLNKFSQVAMTQYPYLVQACILTLTKYWCWSSSACALHVPLFRRYFGIAIHILSLNGYIIWPSYVKGAVAIPSRPIND